MYRSKIEQDATVTAVPALSGQDSTSPLSKLMKAWEAKQARMARRAGGMGLIAVSLAACGGSGGGTPGEDPDDADDLVPTQVGTPGNDIFRGTTGVDIIDATQGGDDIFIFFGSITEDQAAQYAAFIASEEFAEILEDLGLLGEDGLDLEEVATFLSALRTTSEVNAGDTILTEGNDGTLTLYVFGTADLSLMDFNRDTVNVIQNLGVFSSVTLAEDQIYNLETLTFFGPVDHELIITDENGDALSDEDQLAVLLNWIAGGGEFNFEGLGPETVVTIAGQEFTGAEIEDGALEEFLSASDSDDGDEDDDDEDDDTDDGDEDDDDDDDDDDDTDGGDDDDEDEDNDGGGNGGPVDTTPPATAPATPEITLAEDTGTVVGQTSNGQVNVANLEAESIREYSLDNGTSWTAFTGDSFTLSGDGAKTVIVRQTDGAGNESPSSTTLEFTLDTTPPEFVGDPVAGENVINVEMNEDGFAYLVVGNENEPIEEDLYDDGPTNSPSITVSAQSSVTEASIQIEDVAGNTTTNGDITVILGTDDSEAILGTAGSDFIFGFGGNDQLLGDPFDIELVEGTPTIYTVTLAASYKVGEIVRLTVSTDEDDLIIEHVVVAGETTANSVYNGLKSQLVEPDVEFGTLDNNSFSIVGPVGEDFDLEAEVIPSPPLTVFFATATGAGAIYKVDFSGEIGKLSSDTTSGNHSGNNAKIRTNEALNDLVFKINTAFSTDPSKFAVFTNGETFITLYGFGDEYQAETISATYKTSSSGDETTADIVVAEYTPTGDPAVILDQTATEEYDLLVANGDLAADVLIGGEGADIFIILSGGVVTGLEENGTPTDMLTAGVFDTIVGLDLEQDKIALDFEVSSFQVVGASGSLQDAVNALFNDPDILKDFEGKAVLLTLTDDDITTEYLVIANEAGDKFGIDDVIIEITGYTGDLDLNDFILASNVNLHDSFFPPLEVL